MPSTTLTLNAQDNASAVIKKSTDSLKSFFLAYQGITTALSSAVKIIDQTVSAYIESEKAVTQLNAVLKSTGNVVGLTSDEIISMSKNLSRLTTFEDDAILSAQNMLLTFTKIGKEIFPDATETVLNMSQAIGQDLKSSAIQLGKALQDPVLGVTALRRGGVNFSDAQKELIKSLVESGRTIEAQKIIMKELQVEFGGSARAARDTFGGALKSLQNESQNVQEIIGQIVAIGGRDFVESMAKNAQATGQFLESAQGIELIANIMAGLGSVVSGLWGNVFGPLFSAMKDVMNNLTGILTGAEGKVKGLTTALDVLGKVFFFLTYIVKTFYEGVGLIIRSIGSLIEAVLKSGQVFDKVFKGDFKGAFEEAKKIGKDAVSDIQKNLQTFGQNIDFQKNFETFQKGFENTRQKFVDDFKTTGQASGNALIQGINDGIDQNVDAVNSKLQSSMSETIKKVAEDTQKAFEFTFENALAYGSNVAGQLQNISNQFFTNEEALQTNDLKNKNKKLQKELDNENLSAEEKKRIQNEIAANEEQINARTNQLKLNQFNANKALALSSIAINTAQAIIKGYAELGPIGGSISAGIIGGLGAVQAALVASQQPPAFENGGIVPGVNYTGDNVGVRANSGEMILNGDQQKNLFNAINAGNVGGININGNVIVQANNPDEFVRHLRTLQRAEASR